MSCKKVDISLLCPYANKYAIKNNKWKATNCIISKLIELLNDKDDYNVIIEVENKEKSFTAHSRSYVYGGIVNLEKVETRFIFDLMLIANEFELTELSNKLETILIEDKASWLKTHFSLVYHFTSLPESSLVSLLKRDDLQMKEIEIWDYVIKWGITQNPTLPTNLRDWTKENFLTLKTTLQQCLPHIHYFHPFSTIISEDHIAKISSWINRKTATYSTTNIPYKFELILRGTRDGFAPQTFWNIYHGHARTIFVAKVKGTDEIIGGYNPLTWDNTLNGNSNIWMETNDSFIFSLKNGNIQSSILSRVRIAKNAILNVCKNNLRFWGPYFGYGIGLSSAKFNFNLDNVVRCDNYLNCNKKHHQIDFLLIIMKYLKLLENLK
ncbi:hypothetical protein Glove_33g218 [Diversispora epigaea]|uniref:TLDc domain-containing protein n=1 Tax=Diversispora epigaea TaxID=1348612 RepID=A0A397JH45_9GLOM|nr:hypothetical protein Glove_33g218 [Diversispora epigaea]